MSWNGHDIRILPRTVLLSALSLSITSLRNSHKSVPVCLLSLMTRKPFLHGYQLRVGFFWSPNALLHLGGFWFSGSFSAGRLQFTKFPSSVAPLFLLPATTRRAMQHEQLRVMSPKEFKFELKVLIYKTEVTHSTRNFKNVMIKYCS